MALQGKQDLGSGQSPNHMVISLIDALIQVRISGPFVGAFHELSGKLPIFAGQVEKFPFIDSDPQSFCRSDCNFVSAAAKLPAVE